MAKILTTTAHAAILGIVSAGAPPGAVVDKILDHDAALRELVAKLASSAKHMTDTALQLERILKNDCCFGCGNDTGAPHADYCDVVNMTKLLERAKAVGA